MGWWVNMLSSSLEWFGTIQSRSLPFLTETKDKYQHILDRQQISFLLCNYTIDWREDVVHNISICLLSMLEILSSMHITFTKRIFCHPKYAVIWKSSTICSRSLDPICKVNYYIKWVKTSWTDSIKRAR